MLLSHNLLYIVFLIHFSQYCNSRKDSPSYILLPLNCPVIIISDISRCTQPVEYIRNENKINYFYSQSWNVKYLDKHKILKQEYIMQYHITDSFVAFFFLILLPNTVSKDKKIKVKNSIRYIILLYYTSQSN